jgi:hypothetical protein
MTVVIVVLLIIVIILLVNLWDRLSTLSDELHRIERLVIEGKARQSSVASKAGPSFTTLERARVKQRHTDLPKTGRMSTALRRVKKGGPDSGNQEDNRLREDPDQVPGPERNPRRVW